jgi:hypothetical protein
VRIGGLERRHEETVCAGKNRLRVTARQRNSPDVRLGVKLPQVQIPSADQRSSSSEVLRGLDQAANPNTHPGYVAQ